VLSARGRMVDYKIFSFLYRFVCVCQYDFYSCVLFYGLLVRGGIFGLRILNLWIYRFTGFQPARRIMMAVKLGIGNAAILSRPAILAFHNSHGYNLIL
jgi:hypothetical protein